MDYILKIQSKIEVRKKKAIAKYITRSDYDLIKITTNKYSSGNKDNEYTLMLTIDDKIKDLYNNLGDIEDKSKELISNIK
tara:strand:+ start:427 stop:666 length:240 start_codon:yes stop_codon:yes gene_type:complete